MNTQITCNEIQKGQSLVQKKTNKKTPITTISLPQLPPFVKSMWNDKLRKKEEVFPLFTFP